MLKWSGTFVAYNLVLNRFIFAPGANDVANSFASSVGAKALTVRSCSRSAPMWSAAYRWTL